MNETITAPEDIKARMLKNISLLWENKNVDTLDPLVKMLLEVLAGEVFKTHNDIHTMENRLLQKLAILFTPDMLSAPYCAHAIVQAFIQGATDRISTETQFSYTKKRTDRHEAPIIHFTPLASFQMKDVAVHSIAANGIVWNMEAGTSKTLALKAHAATTHNNICWLGLKVNPGLTNINNISVYFDPRNSDACMPETMQRAAWYVNNKQITTVKGFLYEPNATPYTSFSETDPMLVMEREVHQYYEKYFVSIIDENLQNNPVADMLAVYPPEFLATFSQAECNTLKEPLYWIKIVTPAVLNAEMLADLCVSTNAFPVLNRKCMEYTHRVQGISNVIPLRTNVFEYLVSVVSVEDNEGKVYKQISGIGKDAQQQGTYAIRKGGTECMDVRTAKEYLLHLLELIRGESAVFASYGQQHITSLPEEMERLLIQLDQRIKKNSQYHTECNQYVTVDYVKKRETFFLKYWITNSIHANNITAGTKLQVYKGSLFKNNAVHLLTSTVGGKHALDPQHHIEAYKCATLTHNKIITAEDIKACCMHELGNKIVSNISIRKGLVPGTQPQQGLVRCVEVLLKKNNRYIPATGESTDWNVELKSLQSKIEQRSSLNLNIKLHLL